MLKNGLKTFFKSLIYIFVPMGIIYLFFILIVFGMAASVFSAAGTSLNSFVSLVSETVTGAEGLVEDYFAYAFGLIDWNGNFFEILKEVISSDWLYKTATGFLQTLDVSVTGFESQANAIIEELMHSLQVTISLSLIALAVSVWLANFVTRMVIRRKNARRNLSKKIFALILQSTIIVAIFGLAAYLFTLWSFSVAIMAVLYIVITIFTSLLRSWLIHGRGKVEFRKAVNLRNVCAYLLSGIIIIVICIVAFILILLLTNALLAILIAVPLVVYASNIIDVNADSYVVMCALSVGETVTEEVS